MRASIIVLGALALVCTAGRPAPEAAPVPPQGIERLAFMEGRFGLQTHAIVEGEWQEVRRESVEVRRVLDGAFVRFTFESAFDEREFTVEVTLAFDAARGIYRMTFNTTFAGYMDVYEGDFDADGVLRLTNENTGTGFPRDDGLQFARFDIRPTADGFGIEVSYSMDSGKLWQNYQRLHFKRPAG